MGPGAPNGAKRAKRLMGRDLELNPSALSVERGGYDAPNMVYSHSMNTLELSDEMCGRYMSVISMTVHRSPTCDYPQLLVGETRCPVIRNAVCADAAVGGRHLNKDEKQRRASSFTGSDGRHTHLRIVMRNRMRGCRSRGWHSQRKIHEDENTRPICSSASCGRKRDPQHRHSR